jgi:hypothetical protein
MPHGYYTIEQWKKPKKNAPPAWTPIMDLPFGVTLTDAEAAISKLNEPGLYRVVQMQRVVWAEALGGGVKLRKSHAGSLASLDEIRQMFERTRGVYPVEEVRAARKEIKRRRAK